MIQSNAKMEWKLPVGDQHLPLRDQNASSAKSEFRCRSIHPQKLSKAQNKHICINSGHNSTLKRTKEKPTKYRPKYIEIIKVPQILNNHVTLHFIRRMRIQKIQVNRILIFNLRILLKQNASPPSLTWVNKSNQAQAINIPFVIKHYRPIKSYFLDPIHLYKIQMLNLYGT